MYMQLSPTVTNPPSSAGCLIEGQFPSLISSTIMDRCDCDPQLIGQCICTFDEFTVTINGNSVGSVAEVTAVSPGYCVDAPSTRATCTGSREWTSTFIAEESKWFKVHVHVIVVWTYI